MLVNVFLKGDFYYAECYLRVAPKGHPERDIQSVDTATKLLKDINNFLNEIPKMREPYNNYYSFFFFSGTEISSCPYQ